MKRMIAWLGAAVLAMATGALAQAPAQASSTAQTSSDATGTAGPKPEATDSAAPSRGQVAGTDDAAMAGKASDQTRAPKKAKRAARREKQPRSLESELSAQPRSGQTAPAANSNPPQTPAQPVGTSPQAGTGEVPAPTQPR
jgi:hypothetical protein